MSKGSGTRSGLLWEVERILAEIRDSNGELPQILFMENVPQVHSQDNMPDFRKWLDFLESLGYTNYYQDLNAKNYGVAQNRERCFMFSFLGEYNYHFPQPIPLKKKLKDYLEDNVDEKYYINNEKADKLIRQLIDNGGTQQIKVCESQIVAVRGRNPDNPSDRTVGSPTEQRLEVNTQGMSNCLTSVQKDNLVMESQVLTPKRAEYGKQIRKAYESGRIQESRHNMTELEPRKDGISNTLTTVQKDNLLLENNIQKVGQISSNGSQCGTVISDNDISANLVAGTHGYANSHIATQYRIRKLTPRECGRLMGVSDEDIDKMAAVNSNTQLYKQFGNSIVVDVMCAMFKNLNIKQGDAADE